MKKQVIYKKQLPDFGFTTDPDTATIIDEDLTSHRRRKKSKKNIQYKHADAAPQDQVLITLEGKGDHAGESVNGFKMPENIETLPVPVIVLFQPNYSPLFRKRDGYKFTGKPDFSIREAPIKLVEKIDNNFYLVTDDGYGLLYDAKDREKMVYQTDAPADQQTEDAQAGDMGGYGGGGGGYGGGYEPLYPYPPYLPPITTVIQTQPPTIHGRPIARPTHTTFGHVNPTVLGGAPPISRPTHTTLGHVNPTVLGGGQPTGHVNPTVLGGGGNPGNRFARPTPVVMGRAFDGKPDFDFFDSEMTGESDTNFFYLGGRQNAAKALGLTGKAKREFAKKLKAAGWKKGEEIPEELLKELAETGKATPQIIAKTKAAKKAMLEKIKPALKDIKAASQQALAAVQAEVEDVKTGFAGLSTPVKIGLAVGIPVVLIGGFFLVRKLMAKPDAAK